MNEGGRILNNNPASSRTLPANTASFFLSESNFQSTTITLLHKNKGTRLYDGSRAAQALCEGANGKQHTSTAGELM